MSMLERASAKLNLTLRILGRRDDGYHLLESLVVFTDLHDRIQAVDADTLSLVVMGEFADAAGVNEGNLVLKAARHLQAVTGITRGVSLTLEKNIPVGAGLGGGSADAAATLRLLNRLWKTNLDAEALHALAVGLGADVAMCLASKPTFARGVGDVLIPLKNDIPRCYAVLVHPRIPLLTAKVYGAFVLPSMPLKTSQPTVNFDCYADMIRYLHTQGNDLQVAAISIAPQVETLLAALAAQQPTPDYVQMTGSGACCFALYKTQHDAIFVAETLRVTYPQWWVKAVALS